MKSNDGFSFKNDSLRRKKRPILTKNAPFRAWNNGIKDSRFNSVNRIYLFRFPDSMQNLHLLFPVDGVGSPGSAVAGTDIQVFYFGKPA